MGEAVAHDVMNPPFKHGHYHGSQVVEKVLKPIAASYEQTYGPLAHGGFGEFAHNLEAHPLGRGESATPFTASLFIKTRFKPGVLQADIPTAELDLVIQSVSR